MKKNCFCSILYKIVSSSTSHQDSSEHENVLLRKKNWAIGWSDDDVYTPFIPIKTLTTYYSSALTDAIHKCKPKPAAKWWQIMMYFSLLCCEKWELIFDTVGSSTSSCFSSWWRSTFKRKAGCRLIYADDQISIHFVVKWVDNLPSF